MSTSQAQRFLERHGRDVTITNWTAGEEDDYGDPELSPATSTVKAIVKLGTEERRVATEAGEENRIDAQIFVADDTTVNESGDEVPASKITFDSHDYTVITKHNQNNGLLQLLCERTR